MRKGERFLPECIIERDGHRGIQVWGGIAYTGITNLHLIEENVTGPRYGDQILTPNVGPFIQRDRHTFQHDNARPDVTRLSLEHLHLE